MQVMTVLSTPATHGSVACIVATGLLYMHVCTHHYGQSSLGSFDKYAEGRAAVIDSSQAELLARAWLREKSSYSAYRLQCALHFATPTTMT